VSQTLTTLTPVTAGRMGDLQGELDSLKAQSESPFARIFGTHVARFTVVGALEDRELEPDPSSGSYLIFSTDIDGSPRAHVERLRAGLGDWADRLWGHCDGYPGAARARPFRDWLLGHRVPAGFTVAPYRHATVSDVRDALEVRRRLVDLACVAPSLDPVDLKRAWLRELGDGRRPL
jgi:hypothetical protein